MTYLVKNLGILIIVLLLASSIPITYYVVTSLENVGPGILLTINLYDINVEEKKLVDVTPSILNDPNVLMYLEINAIAPPSPEFKEDVVTIIKANMKPKKTVFVKSDKLLDVSSAWVSTYVSRNGNPEETYSGLIIRLFIYNSSSGDVLFEVYDSVSYKPAEITKEKSIKITMSLVSGSPIPTELNVYHDVIRHYEVVGASIEEFEEGVEPSGRCGIWWIERELVAVIGPKSLTSQLPSDYFNNVSGVLYVKTPVLIVSNPYSLSGVISASINIGMSEASVGVYPAIATGQILSSITNGLTPTVNPWRGSGFSWGGSSYYFGDSFIVEPLQSTWVWVWARPIFSIYKVYRVTCTGRGSELIRVYLRDDAESLITNVLTSGTTIVGGDDEGLPHNNLMQMFFNGTEMKKLQIPGTYTEDGDLDPGEYITFEQIFSYFDTCGADFEVGIPVGTIAALGICAALSLGSGTPACAAAIAFASAFQVSLSVQEASAYVIGNIKNRGRYLGRGYNVVEYVYMAISQYQYQAPGGTCYYNVPAGIYFRCD